jgi:hypothetical protein
MIGMRAAARGAEFDDVMLIPDLGEWMRGD